MDIILTDIDKSYEEAGHRHTIPGSFVYWEGAASVKGEGVSGYGYVELVGYKSE